MNLGQEYRTNSVLHFHGLWGMGIFKATFPYTQERVAISICCLQVVETIGQGAIKNNGNTSDHLCRFDFYHYRDPLHGNMA